MDYRAKAKFYFLYFMAVLKRSRDWQILAFVAEWLIMVRLGI